MLIKNIFRGKNKSNNEDKDKQLPISRIRELDLYYKMANSSNRGKCLILNYETFNSSRLVQRTWSAMDVQLIKTTLQQLKFTVQIYENLSYNKTIDLLRTGMNRANGKWLLQIPFTFNRSPHIFRIEKVQQFGCWLFCADHS